MKANSGLKKNRTKIQMVLTALVILSVVRQFFLGNYHNMFLGILTLILFMVPQFLDRKLNVTIPPGLETVILIFIFSAEILGEINAFYVKIPIWDTILHTTNGFLMAAIGFALIDLFNRSDRFSIKMSPYFVAFFAFCFSMTVGVMWEFFEFSMDWFFGMDMQKDWIVPAINSVKLNPTGANVPIHVDVQSLVVNGETWNLGGYLDIRIVEEGLCGRTTIFEDPLRLGRRGTELLPTLLETHTPDAVVLMLGTNDCKTIFGASAEIIGKGIARLLEQINQYADKMKVLVISPIYLGEKVWQDGYDQEFSPESVEVSKKLEPVYEKVAGKYGKRFMRAADYASPSEADQEHMDGQSHKILADAIYRKLEAEIL